MYFFVKHFLTLNCNKCSNNVIHRVGCRIASKLLTLSALSFSRLWAGTLLQEHPELGLSWQKVRGNVQDRAVTSLQLKGKWGLPLKKKKSRHSLKKQQNNWLKIWRNTQNCWLSKTTKQTKAPSTFSSKANQSMHLLQWHCDFPINCSFINQKARTWKRL